MNEVMALNITHTHDDYKFKEVEDYFSLNLDESNFMASAGKLNIVARNGMKTKTNTDNSRYSMMVVRIGSAGGQRCVRLRTNNTSKFLFCSFLVLLIDSVFILSAKGPQINLGAGKDCALDCINNFEKHHKYTPGTHIQMRPSTFMTDNAWRRICRKMCEGIREMPVIKDHRHWWCVLSLDGFGSHLDPEALMIFSEYKILVIKEEGDASQVCQAYNQEIAKKDKELVRDILDNYRITVHVGISPGGLLPCVPTPKLLACLRCLSSRQLEPECWFQHEG